VFAASAGIPYATAPVANYCSAAYTPKRLCLLFSAGFRPDEGWSFHGSARSHC
jgi:hypothetical protein